MKLSTIILLCLLVLAASVPDSYGQRKTVQRPHPAAGKRTNAGHKAVAATDKSRAVLQKINAAICEGQTYILGDRSLTTGGVYNHCFHTGNGDSIITLDLAVYTHVIANDYLTVYATQLPVKWNDVVIPAGAVGSKAFATYNTYSANGCDSIVTLNLTVIQSDTKQEKAADTPDIIPHTDKQATPGGSTAHTNLHTLVKADICQGETYLFNNKSYASAGTFTATFKGKNDDDSTVTLQLNVHEPPRVNISSTMPAGICGNDIRLRATGAESYEWQVDKNYTTRGNELKYSLANGNNIIFLTGTDHYGCKSTRAFAMSPEACNHTIKMPGAFRPGSYGGNGIFKPLEYSAAANCTMQIYNQWGQAVCTVRNLNEGWNGNNSNGSPVPAGIYYYTFVTQEAGRKKLLNRGKVLLVR